MEEPKTSNEIIIIGDAETHKKEIRLTFSFTEYLSIVTGCTILFGIINLEVYYACFNFNVFEFLDLKEIVTLITNNLSYIVILLLGFFFYFEISIKLVTVLPKGHIKKVGSLLRNPKYRKVAIFSNYMYYGLICVGSIIAYIEDAISRITLVIALLVVSIPLVINLISKKMDKVRKIYTLKSSQLIGIYIAGITIIIYLSMFQALIKAAIVYDDYNLELDLSKLFSSLKVPVDKLKSDYFLQKTPENKIDTVFSNGVFFYIGKSSNYVFYYNRTKNNVEVYPDKDIIKYSFK